MKEIGGYLELEQLIKNEYYPELTALNSARFALAYLIRAHKITKLMLPYWLCESVENTCIREGCDLQFYEVDEHFYPRIEDTLEADAWIYIVNYYGQIDNDSIIGLKKQYKNIIVDNVQAFFQKPAKGIHTIYSCRKFFGVPDGAYLASESKLPGDLPTDMSGGRLAHLLGRFEGGKASDYYQLFKENDKAFESSDIKLMSRLTHNLLGAIDYDNVSLIRERNYAALAEAFDGINPLNLKAPVGPFAYPLYLKNGKKIKRQLAEKSIYIPTLWSNRRVDFCQSSKDLAENILPLPCDQRYDKEDMRTVINEVKKCII